MAHSAQVLRGSNCKTPEPIRSLMAIKHYFAVRISLLNDVFPIIKSSVSRVMVLEKQLRRQRQEFPEDWHGLCVRTPSREGAGKVLSTSRTTQHPWGGHAAAPGHGSGVRDLGRRQWRKRWLLHGRRPQGPSRLQPSGAEGHRVRRWQEPGGMGTAARCRGSAGPGCSMEPERAAGQPQSRCVAAAHHSVVTFPEPNAERSRG